MPSYKLPDGKTTSDVTEYLNAWRSLAAPLERAFKWTLVAYNPNLVFGRQTKRLLNVTLDPPAAKQIGDALLLLEEFKKGWKRETP